MQSYGELEAIILKIKSCFLRKVMIMSHKIVQDYKILKYEKIEFYKNCLKEKHSWWIFTVEA